MSEKRNFSEVMAGPKPRVRANISAEEFVRAWQSSKNVFEVSEKLKIPRHYCMSKAATYRQMGVKLKYMPRGPVKIDVAALNELIAETEGGGTAVTAAAVAEAEIIEKAKTITPAAEKDVEVKKSKIHTKRIRSIV